MQEDPNQKQYENPISENPVPKSAVSLDVRSVLPVRLNFILGTAALLMALLVVQLAYLQIAKGVDFRAEVNRSDQTVQATKVPRGMMYDMTGKVVAGNSSEKSIVYTRSVNSDQSSMYKIANQLGSMLEIDTEKLTDRSIIDYWLMDKDHKDEVNQKANIDSQVTLSNSMDDIQQKQIDYLQKNMPSLSDDQKNKAMIFQRMTAAYQLSTVSIKDRDISDDELARVGEHINSMPGIQIGNAWNRIYPQGDELKSLIGSVTTPDVGLPAEQLKSYLAKGYAQNESVGISGLENQYEDALRGSNKITNVTLGNDNQILDESVKYSGAAGNNLNLTINAEFQKRVQDILRENMPGGLTTGGYAAVINPTNGALYALAGVDRNNETYELTDNAMGAVQNPIIMGSAVKPAMVATALQADVITPQSNTLLDQTIAIQGTKDKTSFFNPDGNPIPLSAQGALEVSSNTYMMQLALLMNGTPYQEGMGIYINGDIWQRLRNGFGQFGLGYRTGIDLPGETPGFKGPTEGDENAGKILDESFGNYDSYSVIQMLRYVSAIANGGYLVKPYLVQSITASGVNDTNDQVLWSAEPQVQGKIDLSDDQWNVIREGMWDVGNGGLDGNTGGENLHSLEPRVAAKSGTAETFTNGQETTTASLILYVPGQPVALALAFPGVTPGEFRVNTQTAHDIMEAFWETVMDKPNQETNPHEIIKARVN